jgi:hypothetical protein
MVVCPAESICDRSLEAKHIGQGTVTDLGTMYKLVRNDAVARLLPRLDREVNLDFNAHFLNTALDHGFGVVECPVTFHSRVGVKQRREHERSTDHHGRAPYVQGTFVWLVTERLGSRLMSSLILIHRQR